MHAIMMQSAVNWSILSNNGWLGSGIGHALPGVMSYMSIHVGLEPGRTISAVGDPVICVAIGGRQVILGISCRPDDGNDTLGRD